MIEEKKVAETPKMKIAKEDYLIYWDLNPEQRKSINEMIDFATTKNN